MRKTKCKKCLRILIPPILFLLCFSFFSCGVRFGTVQGYGMGTFLAVTSSDEEFALSVLPQVTSLENEISHRVSSSQIAALNRGEKVFVTDDVREALLLATEISEKTDGAFSPFVLPLSMVWHFDEGGSLPDTQTLADAVKTVQNSALIWEGDVAYLTAGGIDLGALGKGMAADALAQSFAGQSALISVGGSIAAVGDKNGEAWRVGVRDPFSASPNVTVGTLALRDTFVSTSGSYEKCFTENGVSYHHILDPETGMPVNNGIVSVTVVASSGILSDLLSTAVFSVGEEKGASLCAEYGAQVLFVRADGTIVLYGGMADLFTPAEGKEVVVP